MKREYVRDARHHQHHHRQGEVVGAVDDEAEAAARVHVVEIRDGKELIARPRLDLHHEHLEHQREPEQRHRQPEEAEGRRRVVEDRVLA